MIIEITQERFEEIVYAATSSRATIYEAVLPYMEQSEATLGGTLLQKGWQAVLTDDELRHHCEVVICTGGFLLALRHMDLVLTESGFGVVSNDHVAPASAERVRQLEESLRRAKERAYCDVLAKLTSVPGWGDCPDTLYIITQPVYHIEMAERMFGESNISAERWAHMQRQLYDALIKLRNELGAQVLGQLMAALRTDTLTDIQKKALFLVRETMVIIAMDKDARMVKDSVRNLIGWFDKNGEQFPEYVNDFVYKARHAERYENGARKKAFFFG